MQNGCKFHIKFHEYACDPVEIGHLDTFQTEQTVSNYLYPFSSFSVQKFCGRTDRQTDGQIFFQKVLFLLPDQEYLYLIMTKGYINPFPYRKFKPISDNGVKFVH